jgi:two-component system cell cycle sensor histidine kinase/response regulator CckA
MMPQTVSANIMLVEDERIVALDLASTLEELGYTVAASVSTGEAAVKQALKLRPNLVLMDIRLAGKIDGIEAAEQIRKEVDIPIIYLTAHSDEPTLARAKNTGPLAYLVKPFKALELHCAIEIALHRQEMELRQRETREKQLQAEKIESVARLAGGIAQEFNNLLSIVSGYSELLETGLSVNKAGLPRVAAIHSAVKTATQLTRQLVSLSRGQMLFPHAVDLRSILAETDRLVAPLLGSGIELTVAPIPEPVWVRADPEELQQSIVAIISNAGEAMPEGGKITLQVGVAALSSKNSVKLPDLVPGKYATLSVTDDGSGMTEQVKARIFDPFFSTKKGGKGLGLAVVHGFVAQSGGTIVVESQPGAGTTFTIYLPRITQLQTQAGAVHIGSSAPLVRGSENLLLVEDHPQLRALFRDFLDGLGYQVLSAGSGTEAIGLVKNFPSEIQVVVTNVLMPGTNGWHLARELKQTSPDIKVIYTTGYQDLAMEDTGEPFPDEVFLQKPLALCDLATTIRQMLDPPPGLPN